MKTFTSPSGPPKQIFQSHPQFYNKTSVAAVLCSILPSLGAPTSLLLTSVHHLLVLAQSLTLEGTSWEPTGHTGQRKRQTNLVLCIFLCFSKFNSSVSFRVLQQTCHRFPSPPTSISSASQRISSTFSPNPLLCPRHNSRRHSLKAHMPL